MISLMMLPVLALCLAAQLLTPAAADVLPRAACQVPVRERRDAYDQTFDLSQCEERGYCWVPAHGWVNVPWCFHPLELPGYPTVSECAAGAAGQRRDCAPAGNVDSYSCAETHRCCWAAGEAGEPWCFWPAGQGHPEDSVPDDDEDL